MSAAKAYEEWANSNEGIVDGHEAFTAGYAAALRDALAVVEDSYRMGSAADAIRALESEES